MHTKVPTAVLAHFCYMYEWPVLRNCTFKVKTKDLEGIPLLGGHFGYKVPVGAQKHPSGEAQMGKMTK